MFLVAPTLNSNPIWAWVLVVWYLHTIQSNLFVRVGKHHHQQSSLIMHVGYCDHQQSNVIPNHAIHFDWLLLYLEI